MKLKVVVWVCLLVSMLVFSGCVNEGRKLKPALCEKVLLQENKDICYHEIALDKGSESLCGKIVDLNRRDLCYIDLAAGRTYRWED